jgi:hypothetical protein
MVPCLTPLNAGGAVRSKRSFNASTRWQGAASRVADHVSRGALPVRAGQLQR